jgi:hypothetical protein
MAAADHDAARRRSARIVGALLLAIGLLAAIGAWGAYLRDSAIVAAGTGAEGTVVRKDYRPDNPNEYYWITYRFALPDGRRLERSWTIDGARWEALRVGDRIRVRYDAAAPARNFPDGSGNVSLGVTLFVSALGAAFAGFGALIARGGGPR